MKLFIRNFYYTFPLVAALFATVLFSCTKDIKVPDKVIDNDGLVDQGVTSSLTAVIGSDTFRSTQTLAIINDTSIKISGSNANGDIIELYVRDTVLGVFKVGSDTTCSYKDAKNNEKYVANKATDQGNITISSIDSAKKLITGTFVFIGRQTVGVKTRTITEGSFKLKLDWKKTHEVNVNDTVYREDRPGIIDSLSAVYNATDTIIFNPLKPYQYLGWLHLEGTKNGDKFHINFPPNIEPGTYMLSGDLSTYSAYYLDSISPTVKYRYVADGASELIITENNTLTRKVIGTFNFHGVVEGTTPEMTVELSSGKFLFSY